jgi:hypothetical protein
VKTVNLEYSEMVVNLPSVDYFVDRIKAGDSFQFLRTNHAIFDIIYASYNLSGVFDYNGFKKDIEDKNYKLIAQRCFSHSHKEYNESWKHWHKNSKELIDKFQIFLKVFNEYKDLSSKFEIGVSLGVGLNLFWGVWEVENPYQIARQVAFRTFYEKSKYEYNYSGVLKYFSINNSVFKIFDTLNECDYNVVFVGPDYMRLYEEKFNITNFNHINIPLHGAIDYVDEYVDEVRTIARVGKTIVFYSIGHVLTFYMANALTDENIIGIDVGRSFDILIKDKVSDEETFTECWVGLNKDKLMKHVNTIQNGKRNL